ncbi:MAG: RNA-binding cell elongation regulator Jag/EloR [Armatimonadota bacterium]|nr:RNA-binding cell elongation regulator Jag/EloR [Armatimonadota bacterium]MDW8289654.1 RNA-binding cell elongation regulator Jag/EloR [Armatimonadota bacterium]
MMTEKAPLSSVEATGRTVEEAKQRALQMLQVTEEQVEWEILDEGSRGIFGVLGSTPAKVRATVKTAIRRAPSEESERRVMAVVNAALRASGLAVKAIKRDSYDCYVELELVGRDAQRFEGPQLDALQYVLNIIINKRYDKETRVILDVGDYRKQRAEKLRRMALEIAKQVKERGEEAVLDPLNAIERRVIHHALMDDPDVYTYSEGEEPERRVVISPRNKQ